jgi:hypothetical protein
LEEGGADSDDLEEGVVVGVEAGAELGGREVGLEFVAHNFEEVEAGAAAGTPGIGRDAKEAALCLVFVAVDGGEEEGDELGPEVVGGGIFDFGGEELVRVEGARGHDKLVVVAEVPVLEGKS